MLVSSCTCNWSRQTCFQRLVEKKCSQNSFYFFVFFFQKIFIYLLGTWHVESEFHNQGSNPCPLHWELGVLTTGPPGKSPGNILKDR